jgi:hypothetical protein
VVSPPPKKSSLLGRTGPADEAWANVNSMADSGLHLNNERLRKSQQNNSSQATRESKEEAGMDLYGDRQTMFYP